MWARLWGVVVGGLCCLSVNAGETPFALLITEQSRPSFVLLGAGARPAGMGGAFTALADDAAAASYNPAGLAFLVRPELAVVGSYLRNLTSYENFRALEAQAEEVYSDSQSRFSKGGLSFAAVTLPFLVGAKSACLQFSTHRLMDFRRDVERDFIEYVGGTEPKEAYHQVIDQDGGIWTVSMAGAIQLTDRLYWGAEASRWEGDWSFTSLNAERPLPVGEQLYFRFRQTNRFTGWSWSSGFILTYRYFNLGFSYRSGVRGDWKGQNRWETNIAVNLPPEPPYRNVLRFSPSWTVGVALKPADWWRVTVDYSHHQWSDMTYVPRHGLKGEPRSFFDLRPVSQSTTTDTQSWRAGSEFAFFLGQTPVFLRLGYFREPVPVRVSTFGRSLTSSGPSLGLGVKLKSVGIDVAWQRSLLRAHVAVFQDPRFLATGDLRDSAQGTLKRRDDTFVLGVVWQFGSREKLRDLSHLIFVGPRAESE